MILLLWSFLRDSNLLQDYFRGGSSPRTFRGCRGRAWVLCGTGPLATHYNRSWQTEKAYRRCTELLPQKTPLYSKAPQGQHILVGRPDRAFGNNEPMFSFIPHLETAWLPWFTTAASSSPVKLSPGSQPTLASPFSKGLDTKWTSKCKGFSKKCSFHVRSKILPQSMTAPWPLLSILSVPQRERGCATALSRSSNGTTAALQQRWVTARTARYNAEPQRGLSVHHGSASLTLQILMIRSSQPSKCRWREEQSAEHQRAGYPRAHSGQVLGEDPCPHLQHNTMIPNIQQDVLLWKTATGLQGPGDSFIRPYVYFTAY